MITEFTTRDGHTLRLGRLSRLEIDTFTAENEPPTPPMRDAETWAGTEQVPDNDDPGYQRELGAYYRELGKLHVGLIAPAVTLPTSADFSELYELVEDGLVEFPSGGSGSSIGYLLYVLDGNDLSIIVQMIFYNSTVTERAIAEASRRFNVQWMKKSVQAWGVPGTPGSYGLEFEARLAARHSLISWGDFCDLAGPEQSAIVCFYRQDARLAYFQSEWRNRKTK